MRKGSYATGMTLKLSPRTWWLLIGGGTVAGVVFILTMNAIRLRDGGDRGFMVQRCVRGETREGELRLVSPDPVPVYLEPEAAEYVALVADAGIWVNAELDMTRFRGPYPKDPFTVPTPPYIVVTRTNSDGQNYDELEKPGHIYWDRDCHIQKAIVRIPGLAPPEKLPTIVRHELLHALGLDHDEDERSIMKGPEIVGWGSNVLLDGDRQRIRTSTSTTAH